MLIKTTIYIECVAFIHSIADFIVVENVSFFFIKVLKATSHRWRLKHSEVSTVSDIGVLVQSNWRSTHLYIQYLWLYDKSTKTSNYN